MSISIRGDVDNALLSVKQALQGYQAAHPTAKIDLYRQNSFAVRIRVIDPGFSGLEKSDRHSRVWQALEGLPEETQGDISMVLTLAFGEESRSMGNLEFEDPSPSIVH